MKITVSLEEKRTPQEIFESFRSQGKDTVLLEGGEYSYICLVNCNVHVPSGYAGLEMIRQFVQKNRCSRTANDVPFIGGFVGFVSYDVGLDWMDIPRARAAAMPDMHFVFVDKIVAAPRRRSAATAGSEKWTLGAGRAEYFKKIDQIKELLNAGETYQVNFARRFEIPFTRSAWEFYKNLSARNPSAFQVFMETDDWALVSNSPERLFSLYDGVIRTEPIKGTVPRGAHQSEDAARIAELLASEKDDAELSMIVDLSRNDIGKIAQPGSLTVRQHRAIRKLSHVIHTYSTVEARLAPSFDWFDCLKALFPGGSITGCPKKRTMEIIQRLEGFSRGVYCGSAGYIGLDGNCDFNIMIRTAWVDKKKQLLTFHSGGGIVADSDAEKEFEETEYKAAAIFEALS